MLFYVWHRLGSLSPDDFSRAANFSDAGTHFGILFISLVFASASGRPDLL
jgi:hypothetical protein